MWQQSGTLLFDSSGSGLYSGGLTWSTVLRCDDHTGIFTCDGCARDPYFYVPAETQRVVMELRDSLWMNCKYEFGVIFLRCSPRRYFFFKKELIIFVKDKIKHRIFMSYNYQH